MKIRNIFLASCAILLSLPAHADIGDSSSPVKSAENKVSEKRTPLLVIRFNQQHVYFDRVLRQAVEATEKAKAGALYDVVSLVPPGDSQVQNDRINADAAANLNVVVQALQALGVQPSRIHTSMQSSTAATAQEIQIFVE